MSVSGPGYSAAMMVPPDHPNLAPQASPFAAPLEPDPELVERLRTSFAATAGIRITTSQARALSDELTPLFVKAEKTAGNLRYIRMVTGGLFLRFPELLDEAGRG
jgi:hypothetical protein